MTRKERRALRYAMCRLSGSLSAIIWQSARGDHAAALRGLLGLIRETQRVAGISDDERIFKTLASAGLDVEWVRAVGLPDRTDCFVECPSLEEPPV